MSPLNPTAEMLRERLDYDAETGIFTWRYCEGARPQWNTRYSGTQAGTIWRSKTDPSVAYWNINIFGRPRRAHRLAWLYMTGKWPIAEIDHKNVDSLDNRFNNLREAIPSENACNKGAYRNNKYGLKGVSFHKLAKKYQAHIAINRKHTYLGLFETAEEAHAAYRVAAGKLHGEFARSDR